MGYEVLPPFVEWKSKAPPVPASVFQLLAAIQIVAGPMALSEFATVAASPNVVVLQCRPPWLVANTTLPPAA